ncbi:DUF5667 domain-containing protein [Tepidibacillus decaturensis]|uniref:DUF5667 domain-containing protein n=1 Tax=Tepidibacillus decaturensis TaxID=1413211 RepID=A0A135L5P1_9BACI|nr:DUF5667 domain-containing protein [Tepidibacillus decaturensis]KXG44219.1 hypothetical protein U473_09550 [Tepidibacillus decaturensis]
MKKQLATLLLASSLVIPTAVSAAESTNSIDEQTQIVQEQTVTTDTYQQGTSTEATTNTQAETTVNAGLTPEDTLYFLDKLLENVQLTFTFDPEFKASLYADISAERLAELDAISEENKSEFLTDLLAAYQDALVKAGATLEEAKADGKDVTEASEQIDQVAEQGNTTVQEETEELDEEQVEQMEETITNAKITAAVVKDIDPEIVITLKEQGVGYGKIALTVAISNLSGKTVEEVTNLLATKGVGLVAKELGLHPGNLKKRGLTINVEPVADSEENTEDSTTQTTENQTEATTGEMNQQVQTTSNMTTENSTDDSVNEGKDKAKVAVNTGMKLQKNELKIKETPKGLEIKAEIKLEKEKQEKEDKDDDKKEVKEVKVEKKEREEHKKGEKERD